MTNELIVIALIIAQALFFYLSYKERQVLLDRIMAKNLNEYKDNIKPEENEYPKEDENLINIEEAKDEING